MRMPYMPAPTPPKIDLAEHHVDERHHAAERRERVVQALTLRSSHQWSPSRRGPSWRSRSGLPCLPCCRPERSRQPPGRRPGQERIASALPPSRRPSTPARNRNAIAAPHGPAVARRLRHMAKGVGEARRDREDREHLEEVRQWCRILERVGAVGVEEPAAIGAPFLDDFLRRHRSLCDHLLDDPGRRLLAVCARAGCRLRVDQLHAVVRLQVLDDTLRHQDESTDDHRTGAGPTDDARVMSTQKLPSESRLSPAIPRMNAIASAMPVAAETKL